MKKLLFTIICFVMLCTTAMAQNIYAVVVGIPNYQDKNVQQLVLPGKDAKAVADFYKQKTSNVIILTGQYATKAAITKSLKDQFSRATENDAVIFYFSGHGYKGGLCPYDKDSYLSYDEIQQIFRNCKAKRKIIFADACHSGGMTGKYSSVSRNDLEILLFLACRDNEVSAEIGFMPNGVFTTYLLRGLRGNADGKGYGNQDGKVSAKELFNYVSKGVIYKTNNEQHPVMWGKFDDSMILN